ncbi:MAG: cysteine desulfurase [Lachnospiraceae bacterium]|nr:cysteine desulfurase [Lachnospiraceae bacterium]
MEVYLDNSATTKARPEVADIIQKVMLEDYGNPSSMHIKGVDAERYVKDAKDKIAATLKCKPDNIVFTSGGTESDNLAIIGSAEARQRSGKHIITTVIEHPAVKETCAFLEKKGYEITYLPVDDEGVVNTKVLRDSIRSDTILVSIMHTNNEIGSIQPIEEAGRIVHEVNPDTYFHVDAVQGYGKCRIIPKKCGIDLMSVSGHKIHGPKGIGFLYVGDRVRLLPIAFGGGQQKGLRSGTENVPGIAGLAKAAELIYKSLDDDTARLYELRKRMTDRISVMEGVTVNGSKDHAAPHIVSISIADVRAEVMLHALEAKGVYVSSGSACASNKPAVSATLKAIGLKESLLDSTIRISMSVHTTQEEIDYAMDCIEELVPKLRKYTRK